VMDVHRYGILDRGRQRRTWHYAFPRDMREGDRVFRLQAGNGRWYGPRVEPPTNGRRQIARTMERRSLVSSRHESVSTFMVRIYKSGSAVQDVTNIVRDKCQCHFQPGRFDECSPSSPCSLQLDFRL